MHNKHLLNTILAILLLISTGCTGFFMGCSMMLEETQRESILSLQHIPSK